MGLSLFQMIFFYPTFEAFPTKSSQWSSGERATHCPTGGIDLQRLTKGFAHLFDRFALKTTPITTNSAILVNIRRRQPCQSHSLLSMHSL